MSCNDLHTHPKRLDLYIVQKDWSYQVTKRKKIVFELWLHYLQYVDSGRKLCFEKGRQAVLYVVSIGFVAAL